MVELLHVLFRPDYSETPDDMDVALADVKGAHNIGNPNSMISIADTLFHTIVSDDGLYQYKCVDIASKYVSERLWQQRCA